MSVPLKCKAFNAFSVESLNNSEFHKKEGCTQNAMRHLVLFFLKIAS